MGPTMAWESVEPYLPYVISILSSLIVLWLSRILARREILISKKDNWLKEHYYQLAGDIDKFVPKSFVGTSEETKHLWDTWLINRTTDQNECVPQLQLEYENVYENHKNLIDHINSGYRELRNTICDYKDSAEQFIKEWNDEIMKIGVSFKAECKKKFPELVPICLGKEHKSNGYYLDLIIEAFLNKINIRDGAIPSISLGSHSEVYLEYRRILEMVDDKEGFNNLIQEAFKGKKERMSKLLQKFENLEGDYEKIRVNVISIGTDLESSGIPIEGQCTICDKTKHAKRLIPPPAKNS